MAWSALKFSFKVFNLKIPKNSSHVLPSLWGKRNNAKSTKRRRRGTHTYAPEKNHKIKQTFFAVAQKIMKMSMSEQPWKLPEEKSYQTKKHKGGRQTKIETARAPKTKREREREKDRERMQGERGRESVLRRACEIRDAHKLVDCINYFYQNRSKFKFLIM